ncbi:cullin-9-like [Rhinatrema bivittatum]|uniref:cullin-9-like n=1 Tax=Rhinatrema bivittatum TaxID=194408 RepID=UPI001128D7C7|nr:cullin-9-like [Rhinatrema bivittatum]
MMAGERRNGNLLVHLGPQLQAYPEELIRQRCNHEGHTEYLIRWSICSLDEKVGENGTTASTESKAEHILMWMSAEEVYANCPTLLGKRKPEGQWMKEEATPSAFPAHVPLDQEALQDMKNDVRTLVQRATKQMTQSSGPESSILNTIHVLSAYASIGSLAGVFRETGALDLLMKMLCNEEKQIRRSAGKMLRALASHDAGSRAYVLLSLSQQDGIEHHMDFDSRYTLLELFAETTSSEEHCISFEGIHLPQIPGKVLFSLVKRYLCVTSLMDNLNSSSEQGARRQDSAAASTHVTERSRVLVEFEFSMAMANLISELVRVMGWDRVQQVVFGDTHSDDPPRLFRSIFQPKVPACPSIQVSLETCTPAAASRKKQSKTFLSPSDFSSRDSYVEYVQENLKPGMSVRMLEDYDEIGAGDEGVFRQSNSGQPPVQVLWHSTGRTYWVHWYMVEIIGSGEQAEEESREKVCNVPENLKVSTVSQVFYYKPHGNLYSLPYLMDRVMEDSGTLSQSEWWELLFFIKKLEPQEQQEVNRIIRQDLEEQLSELTEEALIQLSVPVELAQKVLQFLNQHCQGFTLTDLHNSHIYIRYISQGGPEQDCLNGVMTSADYTGLGSPLSGVSKKPKKEAPAADNFPLPPPTAEKTDLELFQELFKAEGFQLPEVGEETTKVISGIKGTGNSLVKLVDLVRTSSSGVELQLAGLGLIIRLLEAVQGSELRLIKTDSGLSARDKVVKMLVELLTSQMKEKMLLVMTLRAVYILMSRYNWKVLFATEGGVRAVLACMQEHSMSLLLQQAGLAVLKVLTRVGNFELHGCSRPNALNHSDTQMIQEIFASIGSAASKGSDNLLCTIPAAIEKMLSTPGCSSAVQNGLLVVSMLINNHKTLAEQLVSCDIYSLLENCCDNSSSQHKMLALIVKNRLSEHKLPVDTEKTGTDVSDISVSFDLKDVDLLKLVSSLKESSLSKEIILALERCICEETALLDSETSNLMKDRDTFLMLLRNLEQLRMEKAVQMGVLRILTKLLDNYQDDLLPWHESIEPCLSSMTAHSNDRELVQEFICFLHRLATSNKDCAVVMCRLGMKEALTKALDKHSSNLLLVTELRDLVTDCEKYASLYKQMTTSILAGCIQMVLGQIEEHRRSHQSINIPFFDIFLRNLCQGSSMEVKEDKCWEKVEVSSNPHRANKLTDRNPKTYWESNGSTGSHYINIYMHRGVVIRQLFLLVASEDSSYMPARIIVLGGENSSSIKTELNTVNVLASANRVILIENLTRFWPIIQIRIKRCQQGGIDTRVRGIEVLGPKPTFWPVFKEQLCRRTYLFYTTRAHAWCQEISQDRVQLLQLFNKLNSALRHEQVFADHFLPDDEAAQALGRTCWEALISPLVQSITTPDASSLSPLCWLLTEYLENLELPRCTKCQAAIFNSRVRRLSHLLVHVDTSRPETKELKPPTKSNGKNEKEKVIVAASVKEQGSKLSSMTGITRCWQDVVQQQVKKFLESAWNTSDFVERYRNIYLRLKNAMEELFGQQTAFVMALRHGFSGALLQLSFLTAMHVSEQFARYIDQRIQESWMDSSNRETLRQLQQFLEPMLFLSGLELANTFEHFYRYYLGDRLLTQGKIWLESAVIDKIGLCFPNRFPQQMLKNVSESEELQQEFHLFQLQQLDKRLLDAEKLDMTDDQMDDQIIEDHALRLQKESEVKVLVLSPGCWTISHLCHMDDPRKYFPASLYSYLGKFSDFYTESQSMCGLEHAKPRRLHWTWLGHAEVLYGAVTLHVSTLQMFILLNFNSQQEVSVETLLLSTGLSPVLLGHALKPLTVQGGILTQSDEDRGVLRLNEGWRSGEAAQQSQMWLLPNQTYLNVEEDEGNTLERKRNIICCLLIQIMKKEKEMHIDNLVFQVVDACQKWESGSALKFLSFCCSHTDVLSCIMHLINQGYVRRHEDSPHILEYISKEPTTPHKGQAQIFFKTSEKRNRVDKSKASLLSVDSFGGGTEQGILEAMLLPMGRTMSQDEVALLMAQTVKQVQELLNESLDTAQHLLIHCKWNVDLVIQRFTEEAEQLLIEAGLRVLEPQPPQSALTTCPVCVSQISQGDSPPSLCCKHYCCKSCWNEYLTTRIEQNLVLSCTCPIADCPAQPTADFIRTIISAREIIEKYEKALLRGYVECCSNLTWCTNPQGCDQILCKEGLGNAEACSKCSWMSCFSCSFPEAHYPASCSHMSQWMDDGGFYEGMTKEAQSKHLAKLISKRCPSCQAQIEKNEGCLHMTCTKCNHGFCWRCLKPWKPTHKDYYNCAAMVSKAARQEKRFYDYNERCTFHHLAREFAMNLKKRVCSISAVNDLRSLTFVVDACVVLEQARKVMAYSCVYSYYNQDTEKMDVIEQQTESLELHTSALEILLDEILLHCEDLASCIRLLKVEHFNTGVELLRRIQERLVAILHHSTQDFRIGFQFRSDLDIRGIKLSNVPATDPAFGFKDLKCDGGSDSPDTDEGDEGKDAEDVEYVPDWHEDYDDEDIDDDNFSYDDESENLEQDDFFFDDDDDGEAYE